MPSVVYSGLNPPICFHPLVLVIINLHVACDEMPLLHVSLTNRWTLMNEAKSYVRGWCPVSGCSLFRIILSLKEMWWWRPVSASMQVQQNLSTSYRTSFFIHLVIIGIDPPCVKHCGLKESCETGFNFDILVLKLTLVWNYSQGVSLDPGLIYER